MTEGPLAGQSFPVDAQIVLGRASTADIAIEDTLISRRHVLIRRAESSLEIEDLGSLNGTWVNGERLEGSRRLEVGDVVRVGSTSFQVAPEPDEAGGTVLAPVRKELARRPPGLNRASLSPGAAGVAERARSEDELRPVTALFADVVGSTTLGERLSPDEVKVVIGEFVSRMSRSVERYGGVVQAYMGDGIAAFFGIPQAHEDDPERAARAALAILADTDHYSREVEAAWGISDFNARIGINTGETAVGFVGAADPQAVSLGDTTNVAARLQAAADPGSIVVGEATAQALLQTFVLDSLGELTVKGRTQPVSAWRLVGPQAVARVPPAIPLIDREDEMNRLRAILDELSAGGRGQTVVLLGEAGLGKTRLVGELREIASERATWLEGPCFSYGTDVVFGPFIQILRDWIGAEEGEAELAVWTKLRARLGLLPASQLPDVLPSLARLLSLKLDPADEARLQRLSPHELAVELRRSYRAWIESLARRGPVVLVVEDLHWTDPSSRELIEELLELAEHTQLLLVATTRIDPDSEGWKVRIHALANYPHRTSELRLAPLNDDDARLLVRALPTSTKLTNGEIDLIVARAEGNPLFLEELASAFAVADSRSGETWAPTATLPRLLTPTLDSLLLAKIDALPPRCRRMAQVGAVVGRSFPLRVLEHVAGSDDTEGDLAALLRADVIREHRRHPEPEYVFRHGLLWRACLSTLPPARRRELHETVGTAFETLFAESLDPHLEVIAYHFARSNNLEKALDYLERAGGRAASLEANQSAAELWSRALKVAHKLGDPERTRRIERVLAELEARSSG